MPACLDGPSRAPWPGGAVALVACALALGCARGVAEPPDASKTDLGPVDPPDEGTGELPEDAGPPGDLGAEATEACRSSAECAASTRGPVCHAPTGRCVPCTPEEDLCPPGQFCDPAMFVCRVGCRTDADCAVAGDGGGATRCDRSAHACVGCATDGDCAPGTLCRAGACVPGCSDAHPCGVGATCCAGRCVDPLSSAAHCGGCGRACAGMEQCCMGGCVATERSPMHCGGCGMVCVAPRGMPVCAGGVCGVAGCEAGFSDCDRVAANGCETDVATDVMNCGRCGTRCASGGSAVARCAGGVCQVTCAAGAGDCDGNPANGCEASLPSDPAHCGACGRRCAGGPNATATCAMGSCGIACATGFGDCDGNPANGCEVSLQTSTAHCGACGVACRIANGTAACVAGRCEVASCAAGSGDCNRDAADGCETPTGADNANCGACARRCGAGTACSGGTCSALCGPGTTACAGRCVRLEDDLANCGACGRSCPAVPNAAPGCSGGSCRVVCNPGFGDCNRNPADGCETNLRTSVAHCGACNAACTRANATPLCSDGTCRVAFCASGFADCDGSDATGCEANTRTDTRHCGACGVNCVLPNADARCAGGVCDVSTCAPGFGNCNGVRTDGCETNLRTSNFHCGACGRACGPGTACSSGSCAAVCGPGTTFCAGVCADLGSDARNCGACGRVCGAGQECRSGACQVPPPPNDLCTRPGVIGLSSSSVNITATNEGAGHEMNAPCLFSGGGRDVFYRFDIPGPAPELVYADTFGATWDTVLFFASSCAGGLGSSTTPGDVVCNDDAGAAGCMTGGLQSQVAALLPAGTHYLVLSGFTTASTGTATIHFQHLPVGNGALLQLAPGTSSPSGVTSGTGRVSGSCGGGGPENTYWWRTCPEYRGGAFTATTCMRASWDTLIYLRNANGVGDACNDDFFGSCGLQSQIAGSVSAGAGLHAFYLDGFSSASSGSYTVSVSRP